MHPLVFAVLVGAAASPAPSPSPTPAPLQSIGTVTVVSGSPQSLHRAPQAASVLDARSLRTATVMTLDQALRAMPAFDRTRSNAAFTNYGQLRLSFGGAGSDRGTLFVDGVPAQNGFGGEVDWNAYPLEDVERAELLRGPGSALYGSGAIGGALSLTTLAPSLDRPDVVNASAGGIDRGSASTVADARFGAVDALVSAGTRSLAYDVIPPSQASSVDRTATSTADVAHVKLRAGSGAAQTVLDVRSGDDAQADGRPNDGFSRSLRQTAVTWSLAEREPLAVTAYARATTLTNLADRYPSSPGTLLYTQHVPTSDAGARATWSLPFARASTFAVVLDHRLVTGRSDQLTAANMVQSDVAGTQRLDGLALQAQSAGRLGAIVGARYDTVETRTFGSAKPANAVSPRVALRYDASRTVALRAAFGTGLRAPYLNELVRSYRIAGVQYRNNPNLAPERSTGTQLGVDIAPSAATRLAVDYTSTSVRDAIGFQTVGKNIFRRGNFGRTATQSYTAEYERTNACSRLRGFVTDEHDRVVAGSPAQVGKRLAYVPDATAGLEAERTVGPVSGAVDLSYSGPSFADDLQLQPLGTALLVGARLTLHTSGGADVSLGFENVADHQYLTSVDRLGPPSSLTLQVRVPVDARAAAARATPGAACV